MSKDKTSAVQVWNAGQALSDPKQEKAIQDWLRDKYRTTLTEPEWSAFKQLAVVTNMNPFLGEIYAVKYGNNAASIFIGRNGYRKAALSSKNYNGHHADTVYQNDEHYFIPSKGEVVHRPNLKTRGNIIGAYFLGWRKGIERPIYLFVNFNEYASTKSPIWKSKPATMIAKVAESQGLRMMLPEMFSGTYDESEQWEEAAPQKPTVELVEEPAITPPTLKHVQTLWTECAKLTGKSRADIDVDKRAYYQKKFYVTSTKDLTEDQGLATIKVLREKVNKLNAPGPQEVAPAPITEQGEELKEQLEPVQYTEQYIKDMKGHLDKLWADYFRVNNLEGAKQHQAKIDVVSKVAKKFSEASLEPKEVEAVIDHLEEALHPKDDTVETKAKEVFGPDVQVEDLPFDEAGNPVSK